jgi:hypothetical protein
MHAGSVFARKKRLLDVASPQRQAFFVLFDYAGNLFDRHCTCRLRHTRIYVTAQPFHASLPLGNFA